jgi:glycosyltransferase involved in cell wall biosynthesis
MPLFYNSVDLVIIPSFFEGFSNVVLESYSCGKLIMIGKAVLTPEIKLYGYALDMDLKTWVNKLGYLNEMKLKYGEIARARNARKFIIENFSWGLYEKRMISAFKSVLNES